MTSQLCKRAIAAPSARAKAKPSAPYGDDSAVALIELAIAPEPVEAAEDKVEGVRAAAVPSA
jgi:hypothetical protein